VTVIDIATRRRISCPHCLDTMTVADLDGHLRFGCKVLESKRKHPSNWTPGGVA
jgi:hypothetical protein